ncbi:carboxymuconolactone decarboxylase [Bifidobacterium sp. UTCIF-37]|uniref:carboxymuconolactone decarboxylase family protein n=1 Tax=unclassified Bifidobacterium TaxID=2608897 RepID=UPI001126F587|nr:MULTISPECIES: carboxymuconolactone decarboxylase family protein [unclassified Bifidobacterium]TPF86622.1 carboxymuconolactone decarboxylase [Bifidobacterium sp. UTCIF-37]TPF90240.1 carboxymuconolactone decarboxylase [Bifidobacterium sp. UTCIF-38]
MFGTRKGGLFADNKPTLGQCDPEFIDLFTRFAYDEVIHEPGANHPDLDDATRSMAILATLIGCQGADAFATMLPVALDGGVTPVQVKEIVYQAVAYLGFGRVLPFLNIVNEVLTDRGVTLPLEGQSTTTPETRAEAGERSQIEIFGEGMRGFATSGPEETRHINKWLADNCFGDYYTRDGLDTSHREMITLCFLAAQGGCEPQLVAHAKANLRVGNEKAFLIAVVSQTMPYIGYPRTLNAIRCINEAAASASAD